MIKKRIESAKSGDIFVTSDFVDIAIPATVRKCLSRLVEDKKIRRVMDGIYEKPIYSTFLNDYMPANPDIIAHAIARNFNWTTAPSGDLALNKLGLSTQIPVVWSYVSDGPYRIYTWGNVTISFKHRTNREISFMSDNSKLIVEALKTLGKDRVDDKVILCLKNNLPISEKEIVLNETAKVRGWIYDVIKKVCD